MGQATEIIRWRLENDLGVREAWYETDGDGTNRFFLAGPTQELYRELILSVTDPINAAHPLRYRRFVPSGRDSHDAIQRPDFYAITIDGVTLAEWTADFLERGPDWVDLVQEFIPLP